jgi:hypothetical protein
MAKTVTKETVAEKVTKEELKELVELRNSNLENLTKLGNIDFQILSLEEQKWEFKKEISNIEENYIKSISDLKEKYGDVNIDLETGKITEVNEESKAV